MNTTQLISELELKDIKSLEIWYDRKNESLIKIKSESLKYLSRNVDKTIKVKFRHEK